MLLSVLALALITAAPAFAQDPNLSQGGVNLQRDAGDNVVGGEVVGDDTPDCDTAGAVLESGLCEPGAGLNDDPSTLTDVPDFSASASATAEASAPAAAEYQYQAPASPDVQELPATGGFNLPLFLGVVLVVGGIIGASQLYLRHRRNQ